MITRSRWLPWIAFTALLGSLILLALLQARWLSDIATTDRERLEAATRNALDQFSFEIDRELMRARLLFSKAALTGLHDPETLESIWERWWNVAPSPELIDAVMVVDVEDTSRARRFDGDGWLDADTPLDRVNINLRHRGRLTSLQPRLPGFLLPASDIRRRRMRGRPHATKILVVELDRDYLASTFFPELIERHLVPVLGPDPDVVITTRSRHVMFASRADIDGELPFTKPTFGALEPEDGRRLAAALDLREDHVDLRNDKDSLRNGKDVLRNDDDGLRTGKDGLRTGDDDLLPRLRMPIGGLEDGHGWMIAVRPAAGSLDDMLARARRGAILLSVGVFSILGLAAIALVFSARRAQETAQRQAELTATVSHELRTPIAAVRSLGENLADGIVTEPEQARLYGEQIARQGDRLASMVEHILMLSGLTARPPERVEIELTSVIDEVIADTLVSRPDATIERRGETDPLVMRAEPLAMRRAVQNLIVNALEHGGEPPWTAIDVAASDADVRITIEDRGPGVPDSERRQIFEPFFRGRRAHDRQTPGSGLGLHLVDRIARSHGGHIEVANRGGDASGALFTLTLPRGPRKGR
ncbi:MAG: ATP-binding protein [Acidobacteriota bacterium]